MTRDEMISLRESGMTYQQIADKCGCTRQWVHARIKYCKTDAESSIASKKERAKNVRERCIEMYHNGMLQKEIANEFGYSRVHMCRILKGEKEKVAYEEKNTALQMLSEGYSIMDIAKHLGCSDSKVRYLVK